MQKSDYVVNYYKSVAIVAKKSDDIDDAVAPILEFQFLPFQELILFTLHFTSEPSRVNELEVGLSGHLIAYSVVDIAALSIISR